ncbi:hypothetical protein HGRIS_007440 [Hohenbuehelia grisea]|uniref:Heterokaryon incompatibility domain-containing protein n=1 Tax=Hohenbuehelia grisea TaxID=104357 RepID=A0ABR3J501_9AGAR
MTSCAEAPLATSHEINSLVCQKCLSGPFSLDGFRRMYVSSLGEDGGYIYSTTWENIEASSKATECNWCSLLATYHAAALAKALAETDLSTPAGKSLEIRMCLERQKPIDRPCELGVFVDSMKIGRYEVYADKGNSAVEHVGTDDPARIVSHPDWALASQFIEECASHEYCRPPISTPLPTRLIDCSDPENPRLAITKGSQGRYATLSYVWGGPQPKCLTTANLDEYLQKLPSPQSQTVSDAIYATHKLGIPYLWVDALCILQDSESDKLSEISGMHGIYESSYITLTPEFAYSVREGFLPERRPPVRLPFYSQSGQLGSVLVRHGLEVRAQWESRLLQLRAQASESLLAYEHINTRASVYTRAWCFQELTLSPRVLLFCYPELYYRCRSATTRVTRGTSAKPRPDPMRTHLLFPRETLQPGVELSPEDRTSLQKLWAHVVLEYSERRLTLPGDKLVAIAAVAEAFHRAGAGEYVVGLWRSTILEDLMWSTHSDDTFDHPDLQSRSDQREFRAPSWSWASVDSQVHFLVRADLIFWNSLTVEYEADVTTFVVERKSSVNPFGAILGASLVLQAKIAEVDWNVGRGCLAEQEPDGTADDENRECLHLLLLAVARNADADVHSFERSWVTGLFLAPVSEGTFRRVGQPYSAAYIPSWYNTTPVQSVTII